MSIRPHDDLDLMSLRRLSDSLEATRTMLRQAQQLAQESQSALVGLVNEFCAQELQPRQEKKEDLSLIPIAELTTMLRSRFKSLKLASTNGAANQLGEANRALRELGAELENQRNRAVQAHQQVVRLESQVHALERTLENERQARREAQAAQVQNPRPLPGADVATYQTWLASWKSENRNWERDCKVIQAVGQTGLSISNELEQILEQESQISPRTTRRALLECVQAELLEQDVTPTLDGRPPQSYYLTDKGKWLYQEITGEAPRIQERLQLLKAHKSERHLAVILKTAELFTHLGYQVEREPLQMQIETNRYFMPDLVVRQASETYYIEVEIGEKEKTSLHRKWENALAAGGRICVVTDNMSTLRRIQGGIAQWSRFEGLGLKLYITCLSTLKSKNPGQSPWYAVKEYSPA